MAFSVYKQYWKSVGHILSISVLLFVLLMQGTFENYVVAVLILKAGFRLNEYIDSTEVAYVWCIRSRFRCGFFHS